MNVFETARAYGYKPEDIIQFLSKNFKSFDGFFENALAAGFTADQAVDYMGKMFADVRPSGKVQERLANVQRRGPIQVSDLSRKVRNAPLREPEQLTAIPALAGAGVAAGAAAAGMGALPAILAGIAGGADLLRSYERASSGGRDLSLLDFVKSVAAGAGGGALAEVARKALSALSGEQDNQAPAQDQEQDIPAQVNPVQPQPQQPEGPQVPDDLLEILDQFKVRTPLEITKTHSVEDAAGILGSLLGPKRLKGLEKVTGLQAPQIVEAARGMFSKASAESEQAPKNQLSDMADYIGRIGQLTATDARAQPVAAQEIVSLPSSNVSYLQYDPASETLEVLFKPNVKLPRDEVAKVDPDSDMVTPRGNRNFGGVYRFNGVPKEEVDALFEGATTKTSGENLFRAYVKGKKNSIGAAWDRFKRKKREDGSLLYEPQRIDAESANSDAVQKVSAADRIWAVSNYFDSFNRLTEKSKSKQKMSEIRRDATEALQELSDDDLASIIAEIKTAIRWESPKSYKGSRSKEVLRRADERVRKRRGK